MTVEAQGAELLCDGWMEPVSLVDTESITINGLAIDYKRPPNSAGEIIDIGNGTVDVRFFDWCPVFEGINFCRFMVYDRNGEELCGPAFYGTSGKMIRSDTSKRLAAAIDNHKRVLVLLRRWSTETARALKLAEGRK